MQIVEIRDLGGPNLFGLEPLIKLELGLRSGDDPEQLDAVEGMIRRLHAAIDLPVPTISRHVLDTPGHVALTYPWHFETAAIGIARLAVELGDEALTDEHLERLKAALERDIQEGNHPQWVRDSERELPIVGITGTNGKTTTTRLLSQVLMTAGYQVGWSSSSGVYIQGECVLEGDYSGPGGARRVLREPDLDYAVLETARGGLLLRGLSYESNDVGVFLNVGPDHLSLQGVEKLETLAEVKSVVVRVTRPEGRVVLNADDPLVWAIRTRVRAPVTAITRRLTSEDLGNHVANGGDAMLVEDETIQYLSGEGSQDIVRLDDLPYTYEGRAGFMVENVLAATSAALGLGLTIDEVTAGLRTFRSDSRHNPGRLNVFECEGVIVVVDYAHNQDGLEQLLQFGRSFRGSGGRLHIVVGTAGDRRDEDFRDLGAIAARGAEFVYLKDTPGYERGREPGDMPELMEQGARSAGLSERVMGKYGNEFDAFQAAVAQATSEDVVMVMCQTDHAEIVSDLARRGAEEC